MIFTLFLVLNLFISQTSDVLSTTKAYLLHQNAHKKMSKDIDISGYWEGTITRDEGFGKRVNFDIEVIITQKGKEITGVSIVRAIDNDKTYSAKMELAGKFKSTYLKYIETKIVSADQIPGADWCIKKVELIYKNTNNVPTLEGIWEGVTGGNQNCIPGRVALKRKPPRV